MFLFEKKENPEVLRIKKMLFTYNQKQVFNNNFIILLF